MSDKQKTFTQQELMNLFNSQPASTKVGILLSALDYMQQYNGRSKADCIIYAMDYRDMDGSNDTFIKDE